MHTNYLSILVVAVICGISNLAISQQIGPEFTYQGQLNENGSAANGNFDMEFRLFALPSGGGQFGGTQAFNDVEVINGLFSVELDFGTDSFAGETRWLEVTVEGTQLNPRQKITATPYSTYSSSTRGIEVNSNGSFVGIGREIPFDSTEAFGLSVDNGSGPSSFGGMYVQSVGGLSNAYYGYDAGGLFSARHWLDGVFGSWRLETTITSSNDTVEMMRVTPNGEFRVAPADEGFVDLWIENGNVHLGAIGGIDHHFNLMDSGYIGIGGDTPVVDAATGQSWFDVTIPANGDQIGAMYLNNENAGARTIYGYATNGQSQAAMTYDDLFNDWALNLGPNVIDEIYVNGNNGRVGISTSSPTALLDVNGSGRVRSNMDVDLSLDVGQNLIVGGNAFKPGGGLWSVLSDRRLKKNIRPLKNTLEKMLSLRGVTFEYNDPESINELEGERIGMIAQEVAKVFPDWVEEHDNGYKMLTVRGFEAVVVEAIRDLRIEKDHQIKELREENDELRSRLESLESAVLQLSK